MIEEYVRFPVEVGFTGTRNGMTFEQRKAFRALMRDSIVSKFCHGDCIGADEDAHRLLLKYEIVDWKQIYIYPCDIRSMRAWCKSPNIAEPAKPLARNRVIVQNVNVMVATPSSMKEELRSGTWATIRYAKSIDTPVILILPDGSIERA